MNDINAKLLSLSDEQKLELLNWSEQLRRKTKQGRYKRIDVVTFPTYISGVYTIINRVSGKQYIGQSTCINDRISKHRTKLRSYTTPYGTTSERPARTNESNMMSNTSRAHFSILLTNTKRPTASQQLAKGSWGKI